MAVTYSNVRDVVRAPVFSWKGLLGFAFVLLVVCAVESLVGALARSSTITAKNAACQVQTVDNDGTLHLACNAPGNKEVSDDNKLTVAYLKRPRSLTCTLYRGNDADCKLAKS